jgi:ubiquinone/menaquinone biosynthesis C-methylase UbiE
MNKMIVRSKAAYQKLPDSVEAESLLLSHRIEAERTLEVVGPTLLVDRACRIIDWNAGFEELLARPLRLLRGQNDLSFMQGGLPLFDLLGENSEAYDNQPAGQCTTDFVTCAIPGFGEVTLRRLITQIPNDTGGITGLAVHLILPDQPQHGELWSRIVRRLDQDVTWSRYAAIYDRLLLQFDEYLKLQSQLAPLVGTARRCLDAGTGTGNAAFMMLKANPQREVWAVDSNAVMLRLLQSKTDRQDDERLHVVKADIHSLPGFHSGFFDGVCMANTMYALDDAGACLCEIGRVTAVNGILALSTPHSKTDVNRLLTSLRCALIERGVFDELEAAFNAAHERHRAIDALIHRFSIQEIIHMIESAGFSVSSCENAYVDSVVIVKAVKKG